MRKEVIREGMLLDELKRLKKVEEKTSGRKKRKEEKEVTVCYWKS